MSNIINIKERANKLFVEENTAPVVCGNTNYVVQFDFDDDWSAVTNKLATFEILGKKIFIEFTGTSLNMPAMPNAYYCLLSLTCTPGENQTLSTPAVMIYLQKNDLGIEVQTMDPFVGYYSSLLNSIKKVEDGDIVCGRSAFATTAENAITATSATSATTATYAQSAGTATTATSATTADSATTAGHATTADSATTATSATTADSATTAGHATTADSATTATTATTADSATTAGHATTADSATTATSATTADSATTAGHATTADSATTATSATTAGHATTADSATTATNATYAQTAHISETQVSITGNETISGIKNFSTNIKKNNEVVPSIKEISNTNLLLNANFSINQREGTSYTGLNVYSVDRWKLGDALAEATSSNNIWSFAITGATTAGTRILMSQKIENFKELMGQNVTASIKYSALSEDIAGTVYLSIYDGVNSTSVVLDSSQTFASTTHTVSNSATEVTIIITTSSLGKNCSITPIWCKFELGSFATMYQPRQISEELWLCQRYYQRVLLDGQTAPYSTALNVQPLITLANTMRTQPTITAITYPKIYGIDTNGNATCYESIQFTFKKMKNNLLSVLLKTGNNSTTLNFTRYDFYCLKNGEITLDAEL